MSDIKLDDQDRKDILDWVYAYLGSLFGEAEPAAPGAIDGLPPCGAFVTLHLNGNLRGCIGSIVSRSPLEETLRDAARSAAFSDPRFPPLTREEWAEIDLEISLLSPMERVDSPEELEMGIHGAMLEAPMGRGLFLPQVATEQGWDRETFMDHLCRKAGLPMDYWKNGSYSLYRFSALVFP